MAAAIFSLIAITIATVVAAIAPVWGHLDFSRPAAALSSPVRMSDPTIELRRNLHNTSTASVINYTTNSLTVNTCA
ncbi:transglutaminase-like enzymes [Cutibacterium acnes JCM 18920]|nr:transglutaminase-like enzymes [Cutibacterium acnes JCM 18920]